MGAEYVKLDISFLSNYVQSEINKEFECQFGDFECTYTRFEVTARRTGVINTTNRNGVI